MSTATPDLDKSMTAKVPSARGALPEPPSTPTESKQRGWRTAVAGGVGSYVEWFDYGIYALFAGFFANEFFGEGNKTGAILATFAVFAIGFLTRPTGAWLFGKLSDRKGRQLVMVVSVIMMSGGSLAIGLSPTFAQIGLWAAAILLLARLCQGLAMGAEHGSAPCFLAEQAPQKRRAFFTSSYSAMSIAGSLTGAGLGLLLSSILTDAQMHEFGWRIPFVIAALFGVFGLLIRRLANHEEAPVDAPASPLKVLWSEHRSTLLRIIPIAGAMSLAYWALLGAFPEMAIAAGASSDTAFLANTVGLLVMMCMLPVFAALSDRYGRRVILGAGLIAQAIIVVPALAFMTHNPSQVLLVQIVVAFPAAAIEGALYATLVEKFPARLRGVGVGVPLAIGVAVLGGTSPLVQNAMSACGIPLWGFGFYVLAVLAVGAACAISFRETAHQPLPA